MRSALVSWSTPSNHLWRWLISSTEMPIPGCASKIALRLFDDRDGKDGRAGEKLKMRIGFRSGEFGVRSGGYSTRLRYALRMGSPSADSPKFLAVNCRRR